MDFKPTETPYLCLFSNCIAVHGIERSIICDLQRNLYIPVPHSLTALFEADGLLHTEKIRNKLNAESQQVFEEYIDLLEKQEFVFHCHKKEAKHFPPLSMEWDFPSQTSNMIIDVDENSTHDFAKILNVAMDEVNCRYLQIRSFCNKSLSYWDEIIQIIMKNEIKAIDIIAKDCPELFTHQEIADWVYENRKIRCLTLHSSIENKEVRAQDYGFSIVVAVKEKITSLNHCGVIHPTYFSINIESFTESQHHNTCLNRKIAIDAEGNIKNCPSMAKSYGNIRDTKLIDVVNNPEFQKVWHIKKAEITKCKDCEFRHICTDCRAYLENPEDMYSAPLKCGYDPYTCTWEEWSTNPLKEKAIAYYGMEELVKK
jgi:SPASM domain peptide maturase of grasp-with-spasm system